MKIVKFTTFVIDIFLIYIWLQIGYKKRLLIPSHLFLAFHNFFCGSTVTEFNLFHSNFHFLNWVYRDLGLILIVCYNMQISLIFIQYSVNCWKLTALQKSGSYGFNRRICKSQISQIRFCVSANCGYRDHMIWILNIQYKSSQLCFKLFIEPGS